MAKIYWYFLGVFFAVPSVLGIETESLLVSAHKIPYFIESESKGTFVVLSKAIAQKLNVKIEFRILPTIRSVDEFKRGKAMILLPGSHPKLQSMAHLESEPFYWKSTFIFYDKSKKALNHLSDLSGKRVGVTLGYTYPSELSTIKNIEIQIAPSDETNLLKLQAGRIDAFLGEEKSILSAAQKIGFNIGYNKDAPASKEPIFFAFQKNELGEKWRERFNAILKNMKKTGEIDKILSAK